MEIVGNGFLARTLESISWRHPDVVVLAAGVSSGGEESDVEFARERRLLADVLEKCRTGGRGMVFFSTSSYGMYGAGGGRGREDVPVEPCTAYGRHKLLGEETVRESGVRHLILRLSSPVGPGQPVHQLLPGLMRAITSGGVVIHESATRDLIGTAEMTAMVDGLLSFDRWDETVNIASGFPVPVEAIVDHLADRLGEDPERFYRNSEGPYRISTEKLKSMVPGVSGMSFDWNYYKRVIDSCLPSLCAAAQREGTS